MKEVNRVRATDSSPWRGKRWTVGGEEVGLRKKRLALYLRKNCFEFLQRNPELQDPFQEQKRFYTLKREAQALQMALKVGDREWAEQRARLTGLSLPELVKAALVARSRYQASLKKHPLAFTKPFRPPPSERSGGYLNVFRKQLQP